MPLDLSSKEEQGDSPELAAFKVKVEETARRYQRENSSRICADGLRRFLGDLGLNARPPRIKVKITFQLPGTEPAEATKNFNLSDLIGKTTEEQNTFVAEKIAPKVMVAGTEVTYPVTVLDLEEVTVPEPQAGGWLSIAGLAVPYGYAATFVSHDAQVLHLSQLAAGQIIQIEDRLAAGDESGMALLAAANSRMNPLCGAYTGYGTPILSSTRSAGRFCRNCETSAERSPVSPEWVASVRERERF